MRVHHYHRLARGGLYGASLALLLVAAVVGGARLIEARLYRSYAFQARVDAAGYDGLYDTLLREISSFPLKAAYVKDAVDLVRRLDDTMIATPQELILAVGSVLQRHPKITVGELHWLSDSDAEAAPGPRAAAGRGQPDHELIVADRHQSALLKGQVIEFGRSYRGAVKLFGAFVGELRRDGRFQRVEVRRTPFDIDPQAAIIGSSGVGGRASSREQAGYELLLEVADDDDRS